MHTEISWDPEGVRAALTALSTAYGYTHDDMARRAHVHRSQISRWASGRHRPGYDALDNLLAAADAENGSHRDILARIARTAGYDRLAAAYSEDAHTQQQEPQRDDSDRYTEEVRRADSDLGELYVHVVRDLAASTEGLSEVEREEMRRRAIDQLRWQADIVLSEARRLAEDRRHRDHSGDDA